MTIVAEYSWESDTWTHNGDNPARKAWRDAVAEIADKAKATLPECNGRVDKAVAIVLNGDVELLADGKAKVASQSNGTTVYHIVNGECTCKDYEKAPSHWCKHRIAAGMVKRAMALAKAKLEGINGHGDAPRQPAPAQSDASVETPQSVPAQYITYLHGKPFVRYAGLLALAHERGLVSLKTHLISVTAELALAEAEATFADGKTYSECADSTPQNVPQHIRLHFPRMALTRAKARTLRDALNIGIAALEEVDSE